MRGAAEQQQQKQKREENAKRNNSYDFISAAQYAFNLFVAFFFCLHFFRFVRFVFDEENSITTERMTKKYNNRVVTALPTEAFTCNRIVRAACEISDSVVGGRRRRRQRTNERRRRRQRTVLKLLIDKDSACFSKSSHRNPNERRR